MTQFDKINIIRAYSHRDGKYNYCFKDTPPLPMSLDPKYALHNHPIQMHILVILGWFWYPSFFLMSFVSQLASASANFCGSGGIERSSSD